MKKLFILILFFTFSSCNEKCNHTQEEQRIEKTVTTIENAAGFGRVKVVQIQFEGCEYIHAAYSSRAFMAHKGNCKNKIHCYNEIN